MSWPRRHHCGPSSRPAAAQPAGPRPDRYRTATATGVQMKGPAMTGNVELVMRFHPVGGEDVSLLSNDFTDEAQALEAIARALDERRGLVLAKARYNRETGESGMVINLANVVSVRVSNKDSDTTGQYL